MFDHLQEHGFTLIAAKCQSENGIGPTEERVLDPGTQSKVRSFLGLANFSARFILNFVTIVDPLRNLTRKGAKFEVGPDQRSAFCKLKSAMSKVGTLAYFDKNAHTEVMTGARQVYLGSVLVQYHSNKPMVMAYASRSLVDCQRRYVQTEKEALALVWACEEFHIYLYNMKFDFITDHKSLEVIYIARSKPCT